MTSAGTMSGVSTTGSTAGSSGDWASIGAGGGVATERRSAQ